MTPAFPAEVTAAAREAAKAHLRIGGADEDVAIEGYAATALALAEAFTGTAWIARDGWEDVLPASPAWQQLAAVPVCAITLVEGVPAEGAAFALASGDYGIDIDAEGAGWVRVAAPGAAARIRVTFCAGAAAGWGDLPPPIAQGVVLLTAHLFASRDGETVPPAAVSALWRPFRRMRLGQAEHAA